MKKNWHIPRRTFLRGLGAALALPSLDLMRSTSRAASRVLPPQRLLCVFQPNGVYPPAWDVSGTGARFQLSPILQPLARHQENLLVLSGLDNVGRGHVQLTGAFLTGTPITDGQNAVSLDQHVARHFRGRTRFSSVELGTEPPRQGNASGEPIAFANTVSWSSTNTRLSPEINPRVAFDRLFRDPNSPEARARATDRRSVVDLVLEDARNLRRRAGRRDQQKLDEYLASVRSVETRIERTLNPPEPDWRPLQEPVLERPAPGIPRERDEHLKLMIDLMVLALQTDTTRVGTLMTAHGFSRQNFGFLDGVTSDHHGMSHHKKQAKAVAEYTRVSTWYIEQFAHLLDRLAAVDEGGASLLDNSVVLYGSGMKDGNGHVKKDLPILLAGRGGGRLKPGRHVACPSGTPLANLHLTLARHFGLEMVDFNDAASGTLDALG